MENVSYPGKHTVVHSAGYMHTVPTSPKTMPKYEKILIKKLSTESPWPPGIRRRLIRAFSGLWLTEGNFWGEGSLNSF